MCRIDHTNFNVSDLEKSLDFYKKALGFCEVKRKASPDGSYCLVFLGDGSTDHLIELTWLRDRHTPYDLSDNEIHLAVRADDFAQRYALHNSMGCVCQDLVDNHFYFIADPDGYWIEVIEQK